MGVVSMGGPQVFNERVPTAQGRPSIIRLDEQYTHTRGMSVRF